MSLDFSVIIPARYASSRLPGKMLLDIAGKPMIQRVYEQARQSRARQVVIATDDERILEAAKDFGATAYLTDPDHQSGTDRLQEAARLMGLDDDEIVVNVQGDEPLIPPEVINQVAENLAGDGSASVATLCEAIADSKSFRDPNVVKVVRDVRNHALYFSRAPIPWPRDDFADPATSESYRPQDVWRHIGIYAYRVKLLHQFVGWPMAPLEDTEKLEQLRVLWQGHRIHVDESCKEVPAGVDTAEDLQRVRELME